MKEEIKMPPEELEYHMKNIDFMKALYGHCKAYVDCMSSDKGAIHVRENSNSWIKELDLTIGVMWQIRKRNFELLKWLEDQGYDEQLYNKIKEYLFHPENPQP